MRTTFQEDLNLLESTLHEEGALVLRALRGALNALEQRDHELADEVIAFDDDVDQRYISIEEGVQTLLARQTPVASDLRLVLAILHVNLELGEAQAMREYGLRMVLVSRSLERIGDHAVDIGEQVAYLLTAEFREFTDATHPTSRGS